MSNFCKGLLYIEISGAMCLDEPSNSFDNILSDDPRSTASLRGCSKQVKKRSNEKPWANREGHCQGEKSRCK